MVQTVDEVTVSAASEGVGGPAKRESLGLKWGSLKSWGLNADGPAFEALQRYFYAGPVQMSAMSQRDTPEQNQALCEVIDALNAETVYLDWYGKEVSKDEAKRYILEYDAPQKNLPASDGGEADHTETGTDGPGLNQ